MSYIMEIKQNKLISLSTFCPAGLQKFIFTAKKLPCSDMYDVVEGYIKISMECSEMFSLLEGEKHTETEVSWSVSVRLNCTISNVWL